MMRIVVGYWPSAEPTTKNANTAIKACFIVLVHITLPLHVKTETAISDADSTGKDAATQEDPQCPVVCDNRESLPVAVCAREPLVASVSHEQPITNRTR